MVGTIWQLLYLDFSWNIFGPFQETFSLVLCGALLGIGIASFLARQKWTGIWMIPATAVVILIFLLCTEYFIEFWAEEINRERYPNASYWLRALVIMLFGLPMFLLTGMFAPLLAERYPSLSYGALLALVSGGNTIGLLIYSLLRSDLTAPNIMTMLMGLLLLSFLLIVRWRGKTMLIGATICLATITGGWLLGRQFYPTTLTLSGYTIFLDPFSYRDYKERIAQGRIKVSNYSGYGILTHVIEDEEIKAKTLVHSGYRVFGLGSMEHMINREVSLPLLAYLYAKDAGLLYQLGLGTGITAMGSAEFFKAVEVVEINPMMFRVAEEAFQEDNDEVLSNNNVQVRFQDGIIDLKRRSNKYDAIVNTASSPSYFTANKIYTREFYHLASEKLLPEGVYIGWLDIRLGEEGIIISRSTLLSVFADCRFYALNSGYYIFVCGKKPLEIKEKTGEMFILGNEMMQAIRIPDSFFGEKTGGINTLDKPLLSYASLVFDGSKAGHFMDDLSHAIYGGHEGMHACCEQDADKTPICKAVNIFQSFCQDHHSHTH